MDYEVRSWDQRSKADSLKSLAWVPPENLNCLHLQAFGEQTSTSVKSCRCFPTAKSSEKKKRGILKILSTNVETPNLMFFGFSPRAVSPKQRKREWAAPSHWLKCMCWTGMSWQRHLGISRFLHLHPSRKQKKDCIWQRHCRMPKCYQRILWCYSCLGDYCMSGKVAGRDFKVLAWCLFVSFLFFFFLWLEGYWWRSTKYSELSRFFFPCLFGPTPWPHHGIFIRRLHDLLFGYGLSSLETMGLQKPSNAGATTSVI